MEKELVVWAVDFDGTLCELDYPNIGAPRKLVIEALKDFQRRGVKMILNTCREGELLAEALVWCEQHGLVFDAINDNLPELIEQYGGNCRKISADVYLDDKAINANTFNKSIGGEKK
jgi:hydroxymethylpyrimidine pyrophosphatase-like HAD family hydrolase